MNSDKNPLDEIFPLPPGMKLATRKFGVNPPLPLKAVRTGTQQTNLPLTFRWEDSTLGLTVVINEDQTTGKLAAEAFCNDPALKGKAAASVALFGREEFKMIRKTIKFDQPDNRMGSGCCGSADSGQLSDAIALLGPEMGLLVFMVV